MADLSEKKYQRKDGDTSIFVSKKNDNPKAPILWGKVVLDPKALLKHLEENPSDDGLVELRVSLWGYKSPSGTDYWNGRAEIPRVERQESNALPPTTFTPAQGLDDMPNAPITTNTANGGDTLDDLPF